MNTIFNKNKLVESIGEGSMGSASGILGGLYFTNNIPLTILIGVIGAILGNIIFPYLVNSIPKTVSFKFIKFQKKLIIRFILILLMIALVIGYSFLTVDNYSKGQVLFTTTKVKLKKEPGVGGYTIITLKPNSEVIYLDKSWKRIRWNEDGKKFFNFWRKVKDENGSIGWIYGAYLEEN